MGRLIPVHERADALQQPDERGRGLNAEPVVAGMGAALQVNGSTMTTSRG
jgi:hypothetical protein